MPNIFYRISDIICHVLKGVNIGTNLGLYHLICALISGRFLASRGAVFPALHDMGLDKQQVRRAGAVLYERKWKTDTLVDNWKEFVEKEDLFQRHSYEGYSSKACDLTAFYRPRLKGLKSKHYHSIAEKAMPAVVFGLCVSTGSIGKQRLGIPDFILRGEEEETDARLQTRLVKKVALLLKKNEVGVFDAGFELSDVREAKIWFVLRAAKNGTARRNFLPEPNALGRRAEKGDVVRPTARKYKDKIIEATPPDKVETWIRDKHIIRAEIWENLVSSTQKPGEGEPFRLIAVHDPRYKQPLVLETNLLISVQAIVEMYYNRWCVELVPLAAKPILGAERSFVHDPESRYRLPELALLSGNILSYVAAISQPIATGFWDRVARPTCGRLRRCLSQLNFSKLTLSLGQVREKRSVTDHLIKGVERHRLLRSVPNALAP